MNAVALALREIYDRHDLLSILTPWKRKACEARLSWQEWLPPPWRFNR